MEDLNKMKSIIRSMLISEPTQRMTLRDIARRHREEEGKPIPYIKLGFDSLESFLRSIPDTAKISGYGDGAILTPVINKEVSHIQSLILRQRPPKSKSRPRYRPTPTCSNFGRPSLLRTSSAWTKPRQPAYAASYGQVSGGYRERQIPPLLSNLNMPSRSSPSQARNSSCAGTGQIHTRNFGSAGTSPPLSTKTKQEEVYLPPRVTQELLKIVREDSGQTVQKFEASVGKSHPYIAGIFPNIGDLIQLLDSVDVISGCVYIRGETAAGGPEQAPSDCERPGREEFRCSARTVPAGMEEDSDFEGSDDFNDAFSDKLKGNLPSSENKKCGMSDVLKKSLVEVISCYPTGIWCSMLPDFFKKFHQVELNFRSSGFTNVIEMLQSCPELFVCIQDHGNWKVYNTKGFWADPVDVSDKIKKNITHLLNDAPKGIHIDQFANLYERMHMQRFDHSEMRFGSIDDLFLSINNTVVNMRKEGNRFLIYPLRKTEVVKVAEPAESPAPAVHGDSEVVRLIPSDCVSPGYKFPKLVMPDGIKPDSYLNVLVADVANLDNFYVHVIEENPDINDLDGFTDNMSQFYQTHKQKYLMPPEAIVPGAIGVTLTYGQFCRCIVASVKDSDKVTVIPIDYGCTVTVKKSGVMFLHKNFAQFPPQAVPCRCANLQPPFNEKVFKRRAAERFLELVKDTVLSGHVAQYDKERNLLAISLIDTSGEDDIHINDVLCSEGLASFRLDALITVKAPTIISSLRLLDRLKQEKNFKGKVVTDGDGSGLDLRASCSSVKTLSDVNSRPVDDTVNGVLKPKLSVAQQLAALRLRADNPIPLISAAGPILSTPTSQLSLNRQNLVSPRKLDDRVVR